MYNTFNEGSGNVSHVSRFALGMQFLASVLLVWWY